MIFVSTVGLLIIASMMFIPLRAQECVAAIQSALDNFGTACDGTAGNNVCLMGADGAFVLPLAGDDIVTNPTDSALATTLINVHGNVPLALSEQGLRFVLLGDATLTNNVSAAQAFTPVEAVPITAIVASNLRSLPSTNGRIVNSVSPGTPLQAFGRNSDQTWLRVLHEDVGVWISQQVIAAQGDLNTLPRLTGNERSAMQSFTLATNGVSSDCEGAPISMLVIQAPDDYRSTITANGVDIEFDGTIFLTIDDGTLHFGVISGGASSNRLSVPAGFTMGIPIGADLQVAGSWRGLRPLSGGELFGLGAIQAIPANLLFSDISLPTAAQIAQTLASVNTAAVGQSTSSSTNTGLNCSLLRPTSPLSTMPNGGQTAFYWDGVPGATGYRFNVYDEGGNVVQTLNLNTTNTSFVTDTTAATIGGGSVYSWNIDALLNGQTACSSGRAQVIRDSASTTVGGGGGGAGPTPTPCLWGSC